MQLAQRGLLVLLATNVLTILLHYGDNIAFFYAYPEPSWINPPIIVVFWFVITPIAVLGYGLYRKGLRTYAYLYLYLCAALSLLALGHYRYGSIRALSFKINFLILLEALAACALIAYTLWLQFASPKAK